MQEKKNKWERKTEKRRLVDKVCKAAYTFIFSGGSPSNKL
jgi:hypothetical protein